MLSSIRRNGQLFNVEGATEITGYMLHNTLAYYASSQEYLVHSKDCRDKISDLPMRFKSFPEKNKLFFK